jgi:hypothetical protein
LLLIDNDNNYVNMIKYYLNIINDYLMSSVSMACLGSIIYSPIHERSRKYC